MRKLVWNYSTSNIGRSYLQRPCLLVLSKSEAGTKLSRPSGWLPSLHIENCIHLTAPSVKGSPLKIWLVPRDGNMEEEIRIGLGYKSHDRFPIGPCSLIFLYRYGIKWIFSIPSAQSILNGERGRIVECFLSTWIEKTKLRSNWFPPDEKKKNWRREEDWSRSNFWGSRALREMKKKEKRNALGIGLMNFSQIKIHFFTDSL